MAESTTSGASGSSGAAAVAKAGAGLILFTLATGQFLMTLDTSVMNVSIATVAEDLGTTVTGVQTAITLYTLVMASLMVLGGKVGSIMGRKRAFSLGCIIYGCGSMTTALSPNLTVLIIGWSFLEGIGAVLIMPAIVGLVAGNFAPAGRPKAYGLIAAAGAIAVAVGPVIGGFMTTYFSWRYVFAGEVIIVIAILLPGAPRRRRAGRRAPAPRPDRRRRSRRPASRCSSSACSSRPTWGWFLPKEGATSLFGLSLTFWFIIAGLFLLWLFLRWQRRLENARQGAAHLAGAPARQAAHRRPHHLPVPVPDPGGGVLHRAAVPLGRAGAVAHGHRRAAAAALAVAAGRGGRHPALLPDAKPRRVVRIGMLALIAGILVLIGSLEVGADSSIVFVPMLIIGFGIGALASQLGNVTVSAVPTEKSSEVGGLQNTASQLGASIGTALAGSILIAALTASFLAGIEQNPNVPQEVKDAGQRRTSPPARRSSRTARSRRRWRRPGSRRTSRTTSSTSTRTRRSTACARRSRCWPSWA